MLILLVFVNRTENTIKLMWSKFCHILCLKASWYISYFIREELTKWKNLSILFTQTSPFGFNTNWHLSQSLWTTCPIAWSLRAALGCKSIYHFFNLIKTKRCEFWRIEIGTWLEFFALVHKYIEETFGKCYERYLSFST